MPSYQDGQPHVKGKTAYRPSFLQTWRISDIFTTIHQCKTNMLIWIRPSCVHIRVYCAYKTVFTHVPLRILDVAGRVPSQRVAWELIFEGIPSLDGYDVVGTGKYLEYWRQMTFFTRLFPYFRVRSKCEFLVGWYCACLHNLKGQKARVVPRVSVFWFLVWPLYNDNTGGS